LVHYCPQNPMLDLLLVMLLGFLGSFGHCIGMCGPLAVAFSAADNATTPSPLGQRFYFHCLLNLGRILSYGLAGSAIGALGSVLVAGGELAGIDSQLRQGLTLFTGSLLIWMGLAQLIPESLPKIALVHPLRLQWLHQRLNQAMLSLPTRRWTPVFLGLLWGLIPCGFLYAAQIKAAETGNPWQGAATMLAFGVGTTPTMLGVGLSAAALSRDRRSQLFRLGGLVMLLIGGLTLLRTGSMVDVTGHASLVCLMLALIARPISRLWAAPLHYRRLLGVSAFCLAMMHTLHMFQHLLNWNLAAISFMLSQHQIALAGGIGALGLMLPATITSSDRWMQHLGKSWRRVHLLNLPALILAVGHTLWLGSHYWGELGGFGENRLAVGCLVAATALVLLIRQPWFWSILRLQRYYAPVHPTASNAPKALSKIL
jgi:uncharacterized protein